MRDSFERRTEALKYDHDVGQRLFQRVLTLNNDLASLAPENLLPAALQFEDEMDRERAIAALGSILDFLREVGIGAVCREPLLKLYMALGDAREGRSNKMTEAAPMTAGTPKKPFLSMFDDGMAAASVTILIESGLTPGNSLKAVSAAFGYAAARLRDIRKNVMAARGNPSSPKASRAAVEAYDLWYRQWRDRKEEGMAGRDFVQRLVSSRGHLGTGKLDLA